MQAWPWLWKMAKAEPLTAAARSASANTTLAPLPPELELDALEVAGRRLDDPSGPCAVEPVKLTLAMPGCSAMRAPASWP